MPRRLVFLEQSLLLRSGRHIFLVLDYIVHHSAIEIRRVHLNFRFYIVRLLLIGCIKGYIHKHHIIVTAAAMHIITTLCRLYIKAYVTVVLKLDEQPQTCRIYLVSKTFRHKLLEFSSVPFSNILLTASVYTK